LILYRAQPSGGIEVARIRAGAMELKRLFEQ
jgi:hypothetical protein